MEQEFRAFLTQVLGNTLYLAAKERYETELSKSPMITEGDKSSYLKEAWKLSEKYADECIIELDHLGIGSAEDVTLNSSKVRARLKEVQSRMERELK